MKILISAGPTREKIDPVRFISNRSSGKMGYAIALAAKNMGHEVVLVSGPVNIPKIPDVTTIDVESASEMADAILGNSSSCDVIIMAAAVADYRPALYSEHKIKKLPGKMVIELERTTDILAELGKRKTANQTLVGFAAESQDLLENALGKMERKNLDWIAANLISDGFGSDTNKITLLGKNGEKILLGPKSKEDIAIDLLNCVIP
jgi:phosphopantothenoylcysteine decarboxylase/phosphopantothenate--cysteine ligase